MVVSRLLASASRLTGFRGSGLAALAPQPTASVVEVRAKRASKPPPLRSTGRSQVVGLVGGVPGGQRAERATGHGLGLAGIRLGLCLASVGRSLDRSLALGPVD